MSYTAYRMIDDLLLDVPAHWNIDRMKCHYREKDDRSQSGTEEMLSVSHLTGVTPRREKNVTMFKAESNIGQKLCKPCDIVINTMWAWMAAMGVSAYDGIVSPSYGVYRSKEQVFNPKYLDYLLRTEIYRAEYVCRSTGIRSSRLRLYPDKFLDIRFPHPPIAEQNQIVNYLDWKVSQINKFINVKRKQIELLQEQKCHVMSTTIPHNGKQVRFKKLFKLIKGLNITKENLSEFGIPCVNYGQIHSKYGFEVDPDINQLPFVANSYLDTHSKSLMQYGDFIFADTSEDLIGSGNFTYLNGRTPVFAGYHTIIARPIENLNYRYLAYYFDSPQYRSQIQQRVNGVKVYSITRTILNGTFITLPSDSEQRRIVQYLDRLRTKFSSLIESIHSEIDLLYEYRTRLISDVVTGKLDVRGVVVPEYEAVEDVASDEAIDDGMTSLDEEDD